MSLASVPTRTTQPDSTARPAVAATGLSKTYGNGRIALRDLNLTIDEGEIFGLLGPNGAGKSTTIGILTTLVAPTSGTAVVGDLDVQRDPLGARSRMGVVFQDNVLDNEFTVAENLLLHARLWGMSPDDSFPRIRSLATQLGLADRLDHDVRTLSGGLRRRVEIARGLLAHPQVLFLDEPTVGLDPTIRSEIWRLIVGLREHEGVTVILTTHYLEEAESVCDRVGILHEGSLIALGRPDDLIGSVGEWVIELRVNGPADDVLAELSTASERPPLVSAGVVSATSARSREELAATVAALQAGQSALSAATVRATTLSDVYHHLTGTTATSGSEW